MNASPVGLDDLVCDRQTQAAAARGLGARLVGAVEASEHFLALSLGYSRRFKRAGKLKGQPPLFPEAGLSITVLYSVVCS